MATLPNAVTLANIADGGAIVASDHRNNYSAVQTFLNSLQAIMAAGTSGQVLTSGGGTTVQWSQTATPVIARKTTAKAVNTTVSATDLLNGEVTIAANALSSTGVLRATLWGDLLNNTGSAQAIPQFKLVIGGTTVLDMGTQTATWSASAQRNPWRIVVEAVAQSATNAQWWTLDGWMYGGLANIQANTAFATGVGYTHTIGNSAGYTNNQFKGGGPGTIDFTASKTFAVQVVNGVSNASYETRLDGAMIEVL